MKKLMITTLVALLFTATATVFAGDGALVTTQTQTGQTVTVQRVDDATLSVGRTRVQFQEVQNIDFTKTPEHVITLSGNMYLVGLATVSTQDGRVLNGKVRIQTNYIPEPATLVVNGAKVPYSEIQRIVLVEAPEYKINASGEIYVNQQALIVKRNGEQISAKLRRSIDAQFGSADVSVAVIPYSGRTAL